MRETLRASYVIGRRDFTAIIFSKAFIFFLIGPLFPLIVGIIAGTLSGEVRKDAKQSVVGLVMASEDVDKLLQARETLSERLGKEYFPELKLIDTPQNSDTSSMRALLQDGKSNYNVIYSGTLDAPSMTGTEEGIKTFGGRMSLLSGYALGGDSMKLPDIKRDVIQKSNSNAKEVRIITAQAGQALLFMLTMLLAGMVLSNLVEEKSNKIIEILAASIPMDAVFIGKLFAMLAMATLGICVWAMLGIIGVLIWGGGIPTFPEPAVGWPMFFTFAVIYFALAYLMIGSIFLAVGAQAATVREVQTLSMPATMLQLMVFFTAVYTVTKLDQPIEQAVSIFPLTSPFAMLARAAQVDTLWHHGVAIVGQIFFVILALRTGVMMFRRNVMKSGKAPKIEAGGKRKLFGLIPMGG